MRFGRHQARGTASTIGLLSRDGAASQALAPTASVANVERSGTTHSILRASHLETVNVTRAMETGGGEIVSGTDP